MKTIKILLSLILLILSISASGQEEQREKALREIAAAENAFADYAAANGTKAAFLKYAAADAVVFNPNPANAQEVWKQKEDRRYLLEWRPAWVDAAATGEIGLSTGSSELRPKATDAPLSWGEFFTIWKRQPSGEWLWVLDVGINHEKAPVPKNAWKSPATVSAIKVKNSQDTWQNIEDNFAQRILKHGTAKTYEALASEQIRLLRQGNLPFQGKTAALEFLNEQNAAPKIKVLNGGVISDFAYTYGDYELTAGNGKIEKGHFVRAWKREPKGWRIAADFVKPLPPEKN